METSDASSLLEGKNFQDAMDDALGDEALIAATKAVVNAVNPPMAMSSSDWEVIAAGNLASASSNFGTITPTSIMPPGEPGMSSYYGTVTTYPMPSVPVSGQNLAEAKDALWKLCEQLNASAAKASNIYMPLSDVPPPPPPPTMGNVTSANAIVLDLGSLGASLQASATAADGALLWDDDSDSEDTPMESEIIHPMNAIGAVAMSVNPSAPA